MGPALGAFFVAAVLARMASLAVSRRNERRLEAAGAVEHGAGVSHALAALHTLFYVGCALEGTWRGSALDALALAGIALYAMAMLALVWVAKSLGEVWTIKLFMASDHRLERGGPFRALRHPNYFLNVLPELAGLALALHAWITLAALALPYALCLRARIAEEERLLRERFGDYGGAGST